MSGAAWNVDGKGPDLSEVRAVLAPIRRRWRRSLLAGFPRAMTRRQARALRRDAARYHAASRYVDAFCDPERLYDDGPAIGLGCARRAAAVRALREVIARLEKFGQATRSARRLRRSYLRWCAARATSRRVRRAG